MAQDGNYIFTLDPGVERQHVSYANRYGITLAADLYLPRDLDESVPGPAVLVGSPYGAVKEQAAGIYANELARHGYIALAFDSSYNGYSEGGPRHTSSTDIFTEDFHAGIDYLGTRPFVDRERIGVVGVCASGAFALTAAQVDPRIRALVNVSMIDISASYLPPHPDAQARRIALAEPGRAPLPGPRLAIPGDGGHGLPITLSDDNPMGEFGALYWCEAGHHHSPTTQLAAVPDLSFILPRADASRTDRDAGAHRGGQASRGPTAVRSDPREADHHQAPRRGTRSRSRGPLPPHRSHPLRRDRLLPGPAPEAVVPAKPAPVRRIRRQSWLRTRGGRCCGRPRMPSGPCPGCPGAAGGYPPPWVRVGTGAEASCTWERGDPTRWTPTFVGIPTFFSDRQD